jgi:hypothetical protein
MSATAFDDFVRTWATRAGVTEDVFRDALMRMIRHQIIHTYPSNDLQEHEKETPQCWCHPQIEVLERGIHVIHNSADGRELKEKYGVQ